MTKTTHRLLLAVLFTTWQTACTSSPTAGPPDGGAHGDSAAPALDKADCAAFATTTIAAAQTCGTPLPPGAAAALKGYCEKGVADAAMCGGDPAGGLACFRTADPTDYACIAGDVYPACDGDLGSALGMYCLIALGNPQCHSGIHCEFDVDCSGGTACNSATHECFAKTAACIGLPCAYDVDCPSTEKCNSAEHACVHA
jgi:hypothetical protein